MRFVFLLLLMIVGSIVLAQNPLAKKDPFVGTFVSGNDRVEIRKSGDGYDGTFTQDGQKIPFSAKRSGAGLAGTIKIDGETFNFTAKLDGDRLVVTSDGEELTFQREKPAETEEKPAGTKADPKNPYDGWKLIQHPIGISMRYPAAWQMKEVEGNYQLVPPGTTEQTEIIFVGGEAAEGIKNPEDPMLLAGVDAWVAENIAPTFKRIKKESAKAGNSKGVTLLYEGQGQNGKLYVRMYGTILKDRIVGITAIMDKDRLEKREETLKKMFASLLEGKSEMDSNLVGTWRKYTETTLDAQSSGGRRAGDASSVGNYVTTVVLNPNGTFSMQVSGHSIASGSGVFVESKTDDRYQGAWAASGGKLILMWEDGTEEYTYRVTNQGGVKQVVLRSATKEITYRAG